MFEDLEDLVFEDLEALRSLRNSRISSFEDLEYLRNFGISNF